MTSRHSATTQSALEAARHLCEEARAVLTSLRGGPPGVARGDLAQDLMDLRMLVKIHLESNTTDQVPVESNNADQVPMPSQERPVTPQMSSSEQEEEEDEGSAVLVPHAPAALAPESPMPTSKICNFSAGNSPRSSSPHAHASPNHVGMFARPFLAVVMDPRAAGPHTLVALRALFRLLERGSLSSTTFQVELEPLMKGVLACKFEQTDAGADEAVEMAIADLLSLIVKLNQASLSPATLMDAFNTVFVTRNTFVHSPALCYHFEDVLASMVTCSFASGGECAPLLLEFLVNQLLHTPLVNGDSLDEAAHEAQLAHDATRVLCLRLIRCCLRTGWATSLHQDEGLLMIVQDDLCLSLLMTGQAIWAYHDATTNISPTLISLDVLSEICATLSTLWNTVSLRQHLVSQFEQIYTGFYQRALVLLRKRQVPQDSLSFNANLVFDSEVEIILESLVDLLGLHEPGHHDGSSGAGALEALFCTFDVHMARSDVATSLVVELCRCCGGVISDEGDVLLGVFSTSTASQHQEQQWRQVPAHLKELCAEALVGSMHCLFDEDKNGTLAIAGDGVDDKDKSTDDTATDEKEAASTEEKESGAASLDDKKDDAAANNKVEECSLRAIQSKKRLMRRAARLFNEKSKTGIEFLVTSGLVPDPVTPQSVATFLRNGLVVGLDKAAVGAYLGEIGKAAAAGKSPAIWERDWFHKEVLSAYCALFCFEKQSLLDGLRMFLAAFRLPGEGQMIDRIIQAFADSCGQLCDESARLKLFSEDPKRASDPAFLLAYSIIMLNTDLHNKNIRQDRRMSLEAFIRNNTDYGRDITERGKELPKEFLTSIYESIRDEEIKTENEGAEGHMTVERWKDVLRGCAGQDETQDAAAPPINDREVQELVIESLWMPVVSAIGAFWGVVGTEEAALESADSPKATDGNPNAMLGAQGARLGMDMALDMLNGVRNLGRIDLFQQIFTCVCYYTGLLGEYSSDAVDRTWSFVNAVEAQSAVVVAVQTAQDAGGDIGKDGWKQIWGILFELRDLKLVGGGISSKRRSILMESDPDLLSSDFRREWSMYLVKGEMNQAQQGGDDRKGSSSVLGVVGRALFGSDDSIEQDADRSADAGAAVEPIVRTAHGKEDLKLWDELAPSDDEDDEAEDDSEDAASYQMNFPPRATSAGANFESQLIHEDVLLHNQMDMPVTGLERAEETRRYQISPRARVRKRLLRACDFTGLVSESRFMDLEGLQAMLSALVEIIEKAEKNRTATVTEASAAASEQTATETEGVIVDNAISPNDILAVSPASEAFAEILLCEIVLKNRDRLGILWQSVLKAHYEKRLVTRKALLLPSEEQPVRPTLTSPGTEKCVTGLLRICCCAVMRDNVGNDVLGSLTLLYPSRDEGPPNMTNEHLDRHLGEGLWRICRNIDGVRHLNEKGWQGLLGLAEWCAAIGGQSSLTRPGRVTGLAEDDPALQAYRSMHLLLHAPELTDVLPFTAVCSIREIVIAGERANFPKLSIAGIDLLQMLHARVESRAAKNVEEPGAADASDAQVPQTEQKPDSTAESGASDDEYWMTCWVPILEAIAEAGRHSKYSDVRHHALSTLTDAFIDKNGVTIPPEQLCKVLQNICMPLAGARLTNLLADDRVIAEHMEEIMIEVELCISLCFKPLLHHLKRILSSNADLLGVWTSLLAVMETLLGSSSTDQTGGEDDGELVDSRGMSPSQLRRSTKELASEHLRNAIMVLIASGVLKGVPDSAQDISARTWESVEKMEFCKDQAQEWKQSASQ